MFRLLLIMLLVLRRGGRVTVESSCGVLAVNVTTDLRVGCLCVSVDVGAVFMSVAACAGEWFDDSLHERGSSKCVECVGAIACCAASVEDRL